MRVVLHSNDLLGYNPFVARIQTPNASRDAVRTVNESPLLLLTSLHQNFFL
ncbi:hypothetical protein CKA32_004254 [Geitlerinema sp. FC II]|nr:hypothetical protein CKA32_004254 [Geitlerinema sp. FC II]